MAINWYTVEAEIYFYPHPMGDHNGIKIKETVEARSPKKAMIIALGKAGFRNMVKVDDLHQHDPYSTRYETDYAKNPLLKEILVWDELEHFVIKHNEPFFMEKMGIRPFSFLQEVK